VVNLEVTDFDTGGPITSGNTVRFTVRVRSMGSGLVKLKGCATFAANGTGTRIVEIRKTVLRTIKAIP
jgi:hypothetical protein